ncbi:hypothetical protein [uncultured Planktosalinus sp.]
MNLEYDENGIYTERLGKLIVPDSLNLQNPVLILNPLVFTDGKQ